MPYERSIHKQAVDSGMKENREPAVIAHDIRESVRQGGLRALRILSERAFKILPGKHHLAVFQVLDTLGPECFKVALNDLLAGGGSSTAELPHQAFQSGRYTALTRLLTSRGLLVGVLKAWGSGIIVDPAASQQKTSGKDHDERKEEMS
jgi:hypothetical protein